MVARAAHFRSARCQIPSPKRRAMQLGTRHLAVGSMRNFNPFQGIDGLAHRLEGTSSNHLQSRGAPKPPMALASDMASAVTMDLPRLLRTHPCFRNATFRSAQFFSEIVRQNANRNSGNNQLRIGTQVPKLVE